MGLCINGRDVAIEAAPDTPLLWILRDDLGLTGTKFGCGIGTCGACTVHVNGEAIRACQVTVEALEGSEITTIEGLAEAGDHPVQAAWLAEQVPQCGYCQAGQIMAAAALLKQKPNPTERRHRRGEWTIGKRFRPARRFFHTCVINFMPSSMLVVFITNPPGSRYL